MVAGSQAVASVGRGSRGLRGWTLSGRAATQRARNCGQGLRAGGLWSGDPRGDPGARGPGPRSWAAAAARSGPGPSASRRPGRGARDSEVPGRDILLSEFVPWAQSLLLGDAALGGAEAGTPGEKRRSLGRLGADQQPRRGRWCWGLAPAEDTRECGRRCPETRVSGPEGRGRLLRNGRSPGACDFWVSWGT